MEQSQAGGLLYIYTYDDMYIKSRGNFTSVARITCIFDTYCFLTYHFDESIFFSTMLERVYIDAHAV